MVPVLSETDPCASSYEGSKLVFVKTIDLAESVSMVPALPIIVREYDSNTSVTIWPKIS